MFYLFSLLLEYFVFIDNWVDSSFNAIMNNIINVLNYLLGAHVQRIYLGDVPRRGVAGLDKMHMFIFAR